MRNEYPLKSFITNELQCYLDKRESTSRCSQLYSRLFFNGEITNKKVTAIKELKVSIEKYEVREKFFELIYDVYRKTFTTQSGKIVSGDNGECGIALLASIKEIIRSYNVNLKNLTDYIDEFIKDEAKQTAMKTFAEVIRNELPLEYYESSSLTCQ